MQATEEQKAVRSVLYLLLKSGENWTRYRRRTAAAGVAAIAERQFTALKDHELDNHLSYGGNSGSFEENRVIYVKPPTGEARAVAAIWCRWNFEPTVSRCGFYFGLWAERETNAPDHQEPKRTTSFLGYRYETPEDGKNHDYFHVQPCRSMGSREETIPQALPIPQRNPTWPLAATSSLELLLCLVMSLYGKSGLRVLQARVRSDPSMRGNRTLTRSIKKMLELGSAAAPR